MPHPSLLPSCGFSANAEESLSVPSHRVQLCRPVAVGSQTSNPPRQKHCPTRWQAAYPSAATAQSAAARNTIFFSSAQDLRVVGASRRRTAPRSQFVGPPKGGKCPAPVTLGRCSRQVQPSFRLPPARPNPSFNLSANSRSLGPHSAVVYRRTVRPKRPAVVARLTQTLGRRTTSVVATPLNCRATVAPVS